MMISKRVRGSRHHQKAVRSTKIPLRKSLRSSILPWIFASALLWWSSMTLHVQWSFIPTTKPRSDRATEHLVNQPPRNEIQQNIPMIESSNVSTVSRNASEVAPIFFHERGQEGLIPHPVKMERSPPSPAPTETLPTSPPEITLPIKGWIAKNKTSFLVYTTMPIDREEPCDIPCTYTYQFDKQLEADASVYERRGYSPPSPEDKFAIYLQMEGTHYYPINLDGYHLENSYRWQSPLLKPYFEWIHYQGEYNISNPAVSWDDTINGASFIARNCASRNGRENVVTGLRQLGIRVDGLSACLQTVSPPQHRDKLQMLKPYKFTLAFENGNVQDYVTEKVYQALASGTLPVYMGAPNIKEFVPDNSIINVADFDFNTTLLANHLRDCMENQTLYESYHAWRYRPLPEWFSRKFNFTWASTECRTCRYLHTLSNDLEWDKENQRGVPRRPS